MIEGKVCRMMMFDDKKCGSIGGCSHHDESEMQEASLFGHFYIIILFH